MKTGITPLIGRGLESLKVRETQRKKKAFSTPKKKFEAGGQVEEPSEIQLLPSKTQNPLLSNRRSFVDTSSPLKEISPLASNVEKPVKAPEDEGEFNVQDELKKSAKSLTKSTATKKQILEEATAKLQERLNESKNQGMKPQDWFRLSAAFATPGHFSQGLGKAGAVGAEILDKREANQKELQDLMTKYQLQGAETDVEHTKNLLGLSKELAGAESNYGKIAKDEGLRPNTPEFAARIKQLRQEELDVKRSKVGGAEAGSFDRKTGNYITPSGAVIKSTEVSKDREKIQSLSDLSNRLNDLSPNRLKEAESFFDQTTGIGKAIGSRFGTKAFKAQTEIQASGIQEVLNNLPPGPASDKDIAQAKSSFPGYGDAKALGEWVDRTQKMIERKQGQMTNKYGSESWWGEAGSSSAVAKKPDAEGAKTPPASALKEGKVTRFANGEKWTLVGGKPQKVE
jgi:hypothetical protein